MKRAHPGISNRAAAGHPSAEEREITRFFDRLRGESSDSQVMFVGLERQPDGTWRRAGVDVFPADGSEPYSVELSQQNLARLRELQNVLAGAGITPIGAKYLQAMVDWAEAHEDDVDEVAA